METQFRNILWEKRKEGVLVAAHRGTNGANIIQNTCLSCENALLHSADLVEVDGILSADGIFFAFHDGEEESLWGIKCDIRRMVSTEIERFPCRNQLDIYVDQRVERLEKILDRFKGRGLINIDRTWFYWKEIISFLEKFGMYDQIILKAPAKERYLKELEESGSPVMFMPIIRTEKEWELVQKYDVNVVAVEVIFENLEQPVAQKEFIGKLHEKHILAWVNALTLNDDVTLSALLDDNRAIMNGFDTTWGKLIEMGFDVIQTDWPALLKPYITEKRFNH